MVRIMKSPRKASSRRGPELDLQKEDFAHGGEGRAAQAEELGQMMDRVWHFWNFQGSVLLGG